MAVSFSLCLLLCVVRMEVSSVPAGLPPYKAVDTTLDSAALEKSNATVGERTVQRHLVLANNTDTNFSLWKTSAVSGQDGTGTTETAVPQHSHSQGKPASASPDVHPDRAPTSAVPTPRPTRGPRELQLRLLTPRLGTGSSSLRCFNNNNNNNNNNEL